MYSVSVTLVWYMYAVHLVKVLFNKGENKNKNLVGTWEKMTVTT